MIEMSEQISELAAALSKAQAAFTAIPKSKTAKVFSKRTSSEYSYKYADLADAFDVFRKPLADNGLSIVQAPVSPDRGTICIVTMLLHTSGQWMRSTLAMEATDVTPQSIGTVITYGRRYGLAAMIGLVTDEDTDAQEHQPAQRQQAAPQGRQSGTQQGRPGGQASYNGNGAQRAQAAGNGTKANPPEVTAAAVKAAYQEAKQIAPTEVEPLDEGYEQWDAAALADWLAYYRSFTLKAAAK